MSAFVALARLRVLDVVRSSAATFTFLGLPLVILVILALVFSGGHPFEERRLTLVDAQGELAAERLELGRFAGLRLETEAELAVARHRLATRSTSGVLLREPAGNLRLEVGAREELWARGVAQALSHVTIAEVELTRFGYLHFIFPGLLCSSVMFAGLFGMGYSMARYRSNQFLKKLATMPVSRSSFVLAQIVGRGSLVALQIAALLLVAWLGFELRPSLGGVLLSCAVCLVGLFVFAGIGFLLAALIRTEAVVSDVISGLGLPLTLFSGMFFPLDTLPAWLARACSVLPSTLMVDGVRQALLYDPSLLGVAGKLAGLAAWGALAFGLSVRLFRWHE